MGSGIEEHQYFIFCFKGETPGLHGVGFLIKKEYKNNILSFSGLSERVAILQLEFNKKIISIIQVYAPTEKASKEEMEKFYESLQEAQAQTSGDVLLMGDFNAKVGIAKTKEDKILGKFGYGKRNERGEKLIEFAFEHKLSIMNTYFKMRPNRKWTWKSPNGKVKNELDYILSNQPKSIRKIEVLHGLGYSSDHRLVRATYSLQNTKKCRISFKSSPNIFKTEK
ncbi:craniofacial development protein 2-like [Bombyx mori]|uniref:Endonuclease/exonuclease/phosphatase domain-containing protein n=1 Tax=Bombyx mori TaxID=7091 RepID=A0A8R2M358_BOMMO|nr:craniofacial development protein 2-like [Bombyx mori]